MHATAVAITALMLVCTSVATARTPVQSDVDDRAWLEARGMTTEAWVEQGPTAVQGQKAGNCWHAKVFAAIRDRHGDRTVFAWNKGIGCQNNGRFYWRRQAWDKGTPAHGWRDGLYSTQHWARFMDGGRRLFSHYFTDFALSRSCWALTLNVNQMWTRKVGRRVAWDHYPC